MASAKLSWLLSFDGTQESLDVVRDDERLNPDTVEQAFAFMEYTLKVNSGHFAVASDLNDKSKEVKSETEDSPATYPCLEMVQERWPELAHVYSAILDHLRAANITPAFKKRTADQQTPEENVPEKLSDKSDSTSEKFTEVKENKDTGPVTSAPSETEPSTQKPHPKERTHVPASSVVSEGKPKLETTEEHSGQAAKKPVTKPRSATVPSHRRTASNGKSRKPRPPSPPKDPSALRPRPTSQPLAAEPSPTPSKRKTAPKPPGPPPPPVAKGNMPTKPNPPKLTRTPSAPVRVGKTPPPRPAGKVPPPRPKPPTVQKKIVSEVRNLRIQGQESPNLL